MATTRKAARQRVHQRIRKKVAGTAERPRLAVHFSGKHVYAQVIDDGAGRTLVAASTIEGSSPGKSKAAANRAAAERIGKTIAERLLAKNLDRVVFDRGGFLPRESESFGGRSPRRRPKILTHGTNDFRQATRFAQPGQDARGQGRYDRESRVHQSLRESGQGRAAR